jgi:hypothetical protein
MKASELESKHQAPSDCEARCVELGMRMGAFVLVSDTLPGCVCQPKPAASAAPQPSPSEPARPSSEVPKPAPEVPKPTPEAPAPIPSAAPKSDAVPQGTSELSTSDAVVMAAGVSARTLQTQQQKREQQNYIPK